MSISIAVTLFGQGDGAAKVDCLLGSPVAARAGLFHRAVICSGGSLNGLCSPSYAEICARRLCEKLANAQTTLSTEAAAAEATASDSLAHAELDATRAVEGLVVATQAARDITESVKQTALTEMHGMKMSKLKKVVYDMYTHTWKSVLWLRMHIIHLSTDSTFRLNSSPQSMELPAAW
eukprot:SAG31_NODE_1761_length_7326_cov_2.101148_7_plen_178_part_00